MADVSYNIQAKVCVQITGKLLSNLQRKNLTRLSDHFHLLIAIDRDIKPFVGLFCV